MKGLDIPIETPCDLLIEAQKKFIIIDCSRSSVRMLIQSGVVLRQPNPKEMWVTGVVPATEPPMLRLE